LFREDCTPNHKRTLEPEVKKKLENEKKQKLENSPKKIRKSIRSDTLKTSKPKKKKLINENSRCL